MSLLNRKLISCACLFDFILGVISINWPVKLVTSNKLCNIILKKLRDCKELDFREIAYALNPEGWAEAFGIASEEWTALRKGGVSIVNSYIDAMDILIAKGKVKQRIDKRWEGGVDDTPRFSYKAC